MGDRYKDSRDKKTIPIIRVGTVVSAIDIKRTGRIQCRIEGYDGPDITDANLPYCVPLIPKFLNIIPKEGEIVFYKNWYPVFYKNVFNIEYYSV